MSNPTSNFGWQMPTATDLVTDLPADFEVFGQAVDSSMADLKGGTTGQILAKATSTDMDFTWITNDVGDITAVTAGTGITGGGTTGAVTITNDMATTITASGDIVVGTGSGTYDNLPIGTTGQLLTADTTVSPYKVKWATPATAGITGCALYNNGSSFTYTLNTLVNLPYNAEFYDTDGFHDNATNNTRITIPAGKGGVYEITTYLRLRDATATEAFVVLLKNGARVNTEGIENGVINREQMTGGYRWASGQTVYLTLAATDYIEIGVYSDSATGSYLLLSHFSATLMV
jgi:hypothetical protein